MFNCVAVMLLAQIAAAFATSGSTPAVAPGQLVLCKDAPSLAKWAEPLPSVGTAAVPIKSATGQCVSIVKGPQLSCDPHGAGCLGLGSCATPPKFTLTANGNTHNLKTIISGKQYCVDAMDAGSRVQLYPCVNSPNQGWTVQSGEIRETFNIKGGVGVLGLSNSSSCKQWGPPPPPPPPAPSKFCPKYHPIHAGNVYDPSGPIQAKDGTWHTWEDAGAWSHWWSKDLIHWDGNFSTSTHFGGDTGSVSPTPSGVYAFWPIMSGPGRGAIGSAKSLDPDAGLNSWDQRGPTISMPKRINAGFRDPVRAFEYPSGSDQWYVGVGGGNKPGCSTSDLAPSCGAQFCLFKAEDNTLANFTDAGALYTTNETFGVVDSNIAWQPTNTRANMMECPDLFPLGDSGKWVLIGSLYKTNQWWVGGLSGNPPRFTPDHVGIVDFGNGYAAKTGTTWEQKGTARRLVFGFTGWQEPTAPTGCGRYLIIPRDLSVVSNRLQVSPIPETKVLRVPGSRKITTAEANTPVDGTADTIASGSQVEIVVSCTGTATSGKVAIRTLASPDGKYYTEIGYDFGDQDMPFYVDHSHCCTKPNTIIQRAISGGAKSSLSNMTVWVDGGLIEAYAVGTVITPLLNPDEAAGGAPEARKTTVVNTATGVKCAVESYKLKY